MRFITDFADLAVVLPIALCIGLALLGAGWRQGAAAWFLSIGATLATMLVLKLMFLGCGSAHALSPSGHTAAGTVVYGGAAALWLRRRMNVFLAALLAGAPVAILIGITRIAIHAHLPVEVAVGSVIGIGGIALMLRIAGARPAMPDARKVFAVTVLIAVLLHGTRMDAEQRLRHYAGWLPSGVCQQIIR
jgi:membrane-associated phospholipid phosphatase